MSKTILYVEDNTANRVLVRQVLEGVGYTVLEATDGLSGIKAAQESHPDLILMDINIPGMDGYEAATRIKSLPELSDIPIIALTAKVMAGDRERALAAGCNGYIAKPINVDTLPHQVAEFLGGTRRSITSEQENVYLREYNERLVDRLEKKVQELVQANEALAARELHTPLAAVHGYFTTINNNPYIAGPPITQPEMFFGRQTDLEKITGLLKNNFVMLTGPRRIGKTSLLYQLAYQLSILTGTEQFIPILANIEGTVETEFFHLLMEEIINAVQFLLPPETTTTLSFDLSNFVYPARVFSRDLQTILKGLQNTTPLPSRLVLLLDEMDTLSNYSLETQSQLRRIFQRFTNTNLSIVVAGVKLRQQWAGESSPFYNMFIPVTLSPFPEAEARRLITEPVQGRYIYQDEAIIRILQATSGLPHRIQQLCLEVINRVAATTEGRQEITVEDVDSILPTIQWLDEPTLAPDQVTAIVTAQPAIAEDRTEYHPTTSTSTDQETK